MTLAEKLELWKGSDVQKPNWNSYAASPVSDRAIRIGMLLASFLDGLNLEGRTINRVEPTNGGGVCFSDGDESIWIEVFSISDDECLENGIVTNEST